MGHPGSRASGGSGSGRQRAGRWRLLIRICLIGSPSAQYPAWRCGPSPPRWAGRWSPQLAATSSTCDFPAAGSAGAVGQRTPAGRTTRTGHTGPAARRWRSFPACGGGSGACQPAAAAAQAVTGRGGQRSRAAGRSPSGRPAGAAGCSGHREAARRCLRTPRRRCRVGSIPVRDETPRRRPPRDPMRPRADRQVDAGTCCTPIVLPALMTSAFGADPPGRSGPAGGRADLAVAAHSSPGAGTRPGVIRRRTVSLTPCWHRRRWSSYVLSARR